MNTGAKISELLKEKGLNQKMLAERLNISESALSHYIKGDRIPSGEILANIACALGTTANYLMGKEDILDYKGVKRILLRNKENLSDVEKAELITILFGDKSEVN